MMKTIVYIFSLLLLFGLTGNLTAQEVENPKEELVDKDWYLTKLVIDEEEMPFISNEEVEKSLLSIEDFWNPGDNSVLSTLSYCKYESADIYFTDINADEFYFQEFVIWATSENECSNTENIYFQNLLLYEFWNNTDLYLGHDYSYPFHFTYSIEQHENYQSLIVINDAGYEAHYQSVPYMSVDKNDLSKLNIYPNPVKESFQIENLSEKSNLKIYDFSGKEIFEQEIHSSAEKIEVTQLSSGLYFYGIFQEGRRVKTGKLVKE